jgi:hypothetical protein
VVALIGAVATTTSGALGLLAHLVEEGAAGGGLVDAAVVLWGSLVLVFALVYWELDRGGPVARAHPQLIGPPDFLFTQSSGEGRELVSGWQPSFVDYLYLALTNSTAYSPTDTMPLSHRAKMTIGTPSGRIDDHGPAAHRPGGRKRQVAARTSPSPPRTALLEPIRFGGLVWWTTAVGAAALTSARWTRSRLTSAQSLSCLRLSAGLPAGGE